MQRYAANLQSAAARSFMLGLLSFQTKPRITWLARPAVLQCTLAAAQAISTKVCGQATKQWHEQVLAELKHILHAAAQDSSSHSQLTIQTGEHKSNYANFVLPQLLFAALAVITLTSHIPARRIKAQSRLTIHCRNSAWQADIHPRPYTSFCFARHLH